MPRPAPRVAPATSATRPLSGSAADLVFFMCVDLPVPTRQRRAADSVAAGAVLRSIIGAAGFRTVRLRRGRGSRRTPESLQTRRALRSTCGREHLAGHSHAGDEYALHEND